ncbi:fungal-specific transcription factor domain-containing protein [Paraphoma chrysanthemicola]|uniref:Fungal-specific transcription factor domain-containing protein n=1 Tax=Paraphoma chrysanthemicola TaxID=798071 RepID=A0A8K0QSB5_9PLEO|nr:fungal-specific transcription factor domain-containing protein [Paraphoma chrysanthemicola]
MAESQARVTKPTRPIACNYCRVKKIRCDGTSPCRNCVLHDEECVYSTRRRRRPRKEDAGGVDERLARIEALLQATENGSRLQSSRAQAWEHTYQGLYSGSHTLPTPLSPPVTEISGESRHSVCVQIPPAPSPSLERDTQPRQQTAVTLGIPYELISPSTVEPDGDERISDGTEPTQDDQSSVYSGEMSNWEYHGPRTFLSICSKPGSQWVIDRTGHAEFLESAMILTRYITRRLKIEKRLASARNPEPNTEMANRFSTAYFEHAREVPFTIVNRTWFEGRLKAYQNGHITDDDPAWYALRNAVYASGARIEVSKTGTFHDAYQTAWAFFSNSLSVHTELLYFRTSLMAVQALTIMAYFSEAIGNPCLEYMLSTITMRLAYSKGLHRQPISSWNISRDEQIHRSNLFWANFCLEKVCSTRSGRPSMIDDDLVNCHLPQNNPSGGFSSSTYVIALTRHARLASQIAKRLSQAINQPPDALARTISELSVSLDSLKCFLQQFLDVDRPTDHCKPGANLDLQQVTYIRMAYYVAVFDLRTTLTYPWSQQLLSQTDHETLRVQVQKSTEIVAKTARDAILSTQFLRLDATTSILVAFHGPMYALINLFIHVLRAPDLPTAQSDVTLLEIGAAHFLRLDYATASEIPCSFAKDLVSLARSTVAKSKSAPQVPNDFTGEWNSEHAMAPPTEVAVAEPDTATGSAHGCLADVSRSIWPFHQP